MLLKCIKNDLQLNGNVYQKNATRASDYLEIDKIYIVYGVFFFENDVYYEILTIHDLYTRAYPSAFFEVIDNRLSRFFILGNFVDIAGRTIPLISFPEWANNTLFFQKLVDGDSWTTDIFDKYKKLMKFEFRFPNVKQSATCVGQGFVQCPVCTEYWQLDHGNLEMCQCPNCKTLLLTPGQHT